jgi:hypothetical protein
MYMRIYINYYFDFISIYGTFIVNCPGTINSIIPPHVHISFELLFSAGIPPTRTVGEPGIHGAVVTGIHGIGVNTPNAAAVAAATVGFAGEVHMPKGMIFTNGLLSMIFAIGIAVLTLLIGRTFKEPGANPKLHFSIAPPHTD